MSSNVILRRWLFAILGLSIDFLQVGEEELAIHYEEHIHQELLRFALFVVSHNEHIPQQHHGLVSCDECQSAATHVMQFAEAFYCEDCYTRNRCTREEHVSFT